ncbi:ABC transporter permease [Helicobacter burdigaliensis]|uniref:ABC transporter permease n=1 Tax=Helicobacter burdigaliensis TaxID=2315334 RepID=UPI001E4B9215|nr:ABC transporter permease [Helicobacter burdigaliensis]
MKGKIIPFLMKRYLRFNKSQPFISITAILAFLGVCIGVMVLIVAMAIMNGFDKEFERKLSAMNYPITLVPRIYGGVNQSTLQALENKFPNFSYSPFIQTQAISKSGRALEGALVFGVDFDREAKVNPIFKEAMESATLSDTHFKVIVGKGLQESYFLDYNSPLMLIFTELSPNALGVSPILKRFKVEGFFNSGLINYDKGYIYTTLEALSAIKNLPSGMYDGIHIHTPNPQKDILSLKEHFEETYRIIGWWEQNGNFFSALALEKRALFIVLMLIILVASLNIISSLLMSVMNRRKEIALLLTMGASTKEIQKTFLYLGNFIGISGIVCGSILAAIILALLANFPIISLPADVYGSDKLPLELSLIDLLSILLGSFLIVFASSYYPAYKATKINPLEVLRNE